MMKIKVASDKFHLTLFIPLWSPLVRLGLFIARRHSDYIPETKLVLSCIKEMKRYRRQNGKFTLVSAREKDGAGVEISL